MEIRIHKLLLITVCIIAFTTGCTTGKEKVQRKKVGDFIVEAVFRNDSIIDGAAKFISPSGDISSIVTYNNGERDGPAKNYYSNGKIKDSFNFIDDVRHGFGYAYDSSGDLFSVNYQYYGLRMGPQLFISNGRTQEYFYTDFNKNDLVDCKYDSTGNLMVLSFFSTNPAVSKVINDGKDALSFFAYLPHPPGTDVTYRIGMTNAMREDKYLFSISGDRVLFDTLLPYPEKHFHYFISAHITSENSIVDKVFLEEIVHN